MDMCVHACRLSLSWLCIVTAKCVSKEFAVFACLLAASCVTSLIADNILPIIVDGQAAKGVRGQKKTLHH